MRGPEPVAGNEFCSVCRPYARYTLEKTSNTDSFHAVKAIEVK